MKKGLVRIVSATALALTLSGCATTLRQNNYSEQLKVSSETQKYEPLINLGCFLYLLTL